MTPADAPVSRIAPCLFGSIRFTACCATRKPPKALTAIAWATSAGSRSTNAPRARAAGVVDDHVGRADLALDQAEQPLDLLGLGGVAGKGAGAGLAAERAELFGVARGQRDPDALAGEQPRQRGAQALAGADDQGGLVLGISMRALLEGVGVRI